jgi:hypothetical protein
MPQQPRPSDQGAVPNPAPCYNLNLPPVQTNAPAQPAQTYAPPSTPAIRPMPQMNGVQFPPPSTQTNRSPATNVPPTSVPQPQQARSQGLIGPPAPVPPTPEQMPPSAPKITYQDGLLSVESTNSRLSDILNGIRSRTGIQFEGIQSAQDRVAGKFGPGPANEVLTSLLQGSRFDYVIIGALENPDIVQRVILTPNAASGGAVAGSMPAQPAIAAQQASGEEDESEETPVETQPQPVPVPQASQVIQPPPTGPRTAEQLVEEMKQKQLQSAGQQDPNQANPNQPNPMPPAPIKRRPLGPQ